MNVTMDHQAKGYGRPDISSASISSDIFEPTISSFDESEGEEF